MIVPAKAFLSLKTLFLECKTEIIESLRGATFYHAGGVAMIAALKSLGINNDDRIAVPALICRSLSDRLEKHGYVSVYYDVAKDLIPDGPELVEWAKTMNLKAVLLVDYFGFLSKENIDAAKFLRDAGFIIIVDRCHSFLGNNVWDESLPIDAIFYSIRKTLPVYNGGACLMRDQARAAGMIRFSLYDLRYTLSAFLESIVIQLGLVNPYGRAITNKRRKSYSNKVMAESEIIKPIVMPWLSARQLRCPQLLDDVVNCRRLNYSKLEFAINELGIKPFFPNLPPHVVPQVFLFYDKTSQIVNRMRDSGVGAFQWPADDLPIEVAMDPSKFPNANELNARLVHLPIHQSINDNHIENMINILRKELIDLGQLPSLLSGSLNG